MRGLMQHLHGVVMSLAATAAEHARVHSIVNEYRSIKILMRCYGGKRVLLCGYVVIHIRYYATMAVVRCVLLSTSVCA